MLFYLDFFLILEKENFLYGDDYPIIRLHNIQSEVGRSRDLQEIVVQKLFLCVARDSVTVS